MSRCKVSETSSMLKLTIIAVVLIMKSCLAVSIRWKVMARSQLQPMQVLRSQQARFFMINFWPMLITLWMFFELRLISFIVNSLDPTPNTSLFWSKQRVVIELPQSPISIQVYHWVMGFILNMDRYELSDMARQVLVGSTALQACLPSY